MNNDLPMHKSCILYGTNTGNSQEVAETLKDELEKHNIEIECSDMFDSSPNKMEDYTDIYLVVSTWGEGEPPDDSEDFFEALKSLPDNHFSGKRHAVCGLGDSSYDIFNGFGKDIETEMNRLGSKQILDRVDCDIDFEVLSDPWIEKIVDYEKSNRS